MQAHFARWLSAHERRGENCKTRGFPLRNKKFLSNKILEKKIEKNTKRHAPIRGSFDRWTYAALQKRQKRSRKLQGVADMYGSLHARISILNKTSYIG